MERLLLKLRERKITVNLENGNLKLNIPKGTDVKDIMDEIKQSKQKLIDYIHKRLLLAKEMFPKRFQYIHHYTEERAHQLLAASDMILCPSLFEPCGLVQMCALAFGTVPLVRPVGGLRDTIIPHNLTSHYSTGFYIKELDHENLKQTIQEAVYVYQQQEEEWNGIIERGMAKDDSWKNVIHQYHSFFDTIREHSKENREVLVNEMV